MRKLAALLFLALVAAGAYAAAPAVTAWQIREAIRDGDAAYLDRKIEWASVRTTLRGSLATIAFDVPDTSLLDESDPGYRKPGLWKRFKAYLGRGALNSFVDSYVSAEGLPKLFEYRKLYRDKISGQAEPPKSLANLPQRIAAFWSRVVRFEFHSLTAFELEVRDRNDPDRHFVGLLELMGAEWKLTELRIRSANQMARVVSAAAR